MSNQMSVQFVPEVGTTRLREHIRRSFIRGQSFGIMGPSGAGKTQTVTDLASTITAQDLAGHPNGCDGVMVNVLNCAMYDEITVRGALVAGDTYIDPYSQRPTVACDYAVPIWYHEATQLLIDNPTKHLVIAIDEINLGIPPFQAVLLALMDYKGVGTHQFSDADKSRISFIAMGNRPEDMPASNFLTGPLARRISKWFRIRPEAPDVVEYLGERGVLAPEVEKVLNDHPSLVCLTGVASNGRVEGLNVLDDDDKEPDYGSAIPVVNGLNPATWHEVSLEMMDLRHQGSEYSPAFKREILEAMVPKAVAHELYIAMELADRFATMAQVESDPEGVDTPKGALHQSMQVRMLLPALTPLNVAAYITYVKRMPETAASCIVAYLVRRQAQVGVQGKELSRSRIKDMDPAVYSALMQGFVAAFTRLAAKTAGHAVNFGKQVAVDTEELSVTAPVVAPVPQVQPAPQSAPPVAAPPLTPVATLPAAPASKDEQYF